MGEKALLGPTKQSSLPNGTCNMAVLLGLIGWINVNEGGDPSTWLYAMWSFKDYN